MLLCPAQAKGLGIRLATPIPADADAARGVKYRSRHKGFRTGEKAKMAAITGESIFGLDSESPEQARLKAVLVKAAKLGLKTRGMRLLKPGAGGGGGGRATRQQSHGSSSSCGTGRTRRFSAEKHGQDSDRSTRLRRGAGEIATRSGMEGEGRGERVGAGVVGVDDQPVKEIDGGDVELAGEGVRRGLPQAREAEVSTNKADSLLRKKRRKRGSLSKPSWAAAGTVFNNGGLAAIASLY